MTVITSQVAKLEGTEHGIEEQRIHIHRIQQELKCPTSLSDSWIYLDNQPYPFFTSIEPNSVEGQV